VTEPDFPTSAAWRSEVNRRLRQALVYLHSQGAPASTAEDITRLWQSIALETFTPVGKPQ
jgi:hypothetical protein